MGSVDANAPSIRVSTAACWLRAPSCIEWLLRPLRILTPAPLRVPHPSFTHWHEMAAQESARSSRDKGSLPAPIVVAERTEDVPTG